MGTNFYTDSHGERWGVMMQQKKVSCGLACAAMAEVYMKSQVKANMEATFRQISQKFPENFKEDRGASMDNITNVLRDRGIHCYDNHDYGAGGVWPYLYHYAKDISPVIVYISWGAGNGAHATLCVHVYKSDQKCIFLDPGYGLVELSGSVLPSYPVTDNTGVEGGGIIARGTLTGPMIITKASS
jgi:Papain-like cysteine protease AvrRpt2